MSTLPHPDEFASLLTATQAYAQAFLDQLATEPTSRPRPDLPPPALPEQGLGSLAALQAFDTHFRSSLVASAGPRYWGFVTGGSTPASIAGDWLTAIFDQNPQGTTGRMGGDISALIEQHTIALYRQLFGLPDAFVGGFVTGATMANFTGLAVARQWAGARLGIDVAREGIAPGQVRVLAATPHSSAIKSLAMLGLGSHSLEVVGTLPDREAMDVAHLRGLLAQQPGKPVVVVASGGTVNTVDYDDLAALTELRNQYPFWLHVDAAFGGFAVLSPRFADRLVGWEVADSLTIDNHKWLNVPYDSAVWLVQREHALLQTQTFQNANAPYLGDPLANFSYLNVGPENSRRLRALPVWMTLMAYGRGGYQTIVERSVAVARAFGRRIEASTFARLAAPVRLNVVCFSLHDPQKQVAFLEALNAAEQVFVSPTVYLGKSCLRAAFVNWRTTEADVDRAIDSMETAYWAVA